jgi:N-acetylmuramic acid 6-phosphate etherase
MVRSHQHAAAAVAAVLSDIEKAAAGIERCLAAGGRLVYMGAGTSGRLALQDAAELVPTFGFERAQVLIAGGQAAQDRPVEHAEDDIYQAQQEVQALQLGQHDAFIAVAASGHTPYTLAGLTSARQAGAFTVALANNAAAPLLSAAEVGIFLDSGAEVLAGSTRLAAGTAQKITLNMLSTAVLVRLGGAYGNVMVGMRPTNDKLKQRAVNIVQDAAKVSEEVARAALLASHWHLRSAIVIATTQVTPERAATILSKHHQRVRDALQALDNESGER